MCKAQLGAFVQEELPVHKLYNCREALLTIDNFSVAGFSVHICNETDINGRYREVSQKRIDEKTLRRRGPYLAPLELWGES